MPEEHTQVSNSRESRLLTGYPEMANDQEHEAEALEWCEGLIADVPREESDCSHKVGDCLPSSKRCKG